MSRITFHRVITVLSFSSSSLISLGSEIKAAPGKYEEAVKDYLSSYYQTSPPSSFSLFLSFPLHSSSQHHIGTYSMHLLYSS